MEREELQKLIDKNLSIRDICKELDKSYSSVRHWLGKYGLKTNHRPFNVKDYTEEEKEFLRIKRNKRINVSNRNRARERK
jgi:transposase